MQARWYNAVYSHVAALYRKGILFHAESLFQAHMRDGGYEPQFVKSICYRLLRAVGERHQLSDDTCTRGSIFYTENKPQCAFNTPRCHPGSHNAGWQQLDNTSRTLSRHAECINNVV